VSDRKAAQTTAELLAGDGVPPPARMLEVAVDHASYRVPLAAPDQTVRSVLRSVVGGEFSSADDVAVLDDRSLVGLVTIERLLAAAPDAEMAEIMDADPPVVDPDCDQEAVAWKMVEHGQSSVAVVDDSGRFAGLVSPHDMLGVLLQEHDEDLARMGGYVRGTRVARRAAEERISRRLWHRLPWLLIGLVGAMASAVIVGAFEEQLKEVLLLAFFLPAVVYLADAVGTQTEAILIRGLSVGMEMPKVVRRELLTGLIIGVLIGLAFLPFALLGWGNEQVAVAVALALVAACSIATLVAMGLPLLFQRFGADPAFGSGPLATVIQDLLSILVYLAIAAPVAT
jgi:magnesium transporter